MAPIIVTSFNSMPIMYLFLIFFSLSLPASSQLTWNDYGNIQNGRITVYDYPNLANSKTATASYTTSFSIASGIPKGVVIGFTGFEIPSTTDFSIATSKTLGVSSFVLDVVLYNNTVVYKLKVEYMVMVYTNNIFHKYTVNYYPTGSISSGTGYRSENYVVYKNITAETFYATANLGSIIVFQGFRILNPSGSYIYIDAIMNIPVVGTFNTTLITNDNCQVEYVKYSMVFFNLAAADVNTVLIINLGWVGLTSNSTIASNFFSSIRNRYQDINRMFFGMGSFNFTKTDSKAFIIDTSVASNIYSTYGLSVISNIKLAYFFYVQRNCPGGQYFYTNWVDHSLDSCVTTCTSYSDRPTNDNTDNKCLACHVTCQTCNANSAGSCLSCNATMNRVINGGAPSNCQCMNGYVPDPAGSGWCYPCRNYMTGCSDCSSTSVCTNCLTGYNGPSSGSCSCPTNWIVNGYCNYILGCVMISVINSTQTCTTCNSSKLMELSLTFNCDCIYGATLSGQKCVAICGDDYVLPVQGCDDGNTADEDGCGSSCTVEADWACVGTYAQGSTCKIVNVTQLTYIGAIRDTSSNTAILYYKLSPYYKQYSKIDLKSYLSTNVPNDNLEVSYNPQSQLMNVKVDYNEHLQNNPYSLQLHLNNSLYFWNASSTLTTTLRGVNCQLTFDQQLWMYNILKWVVLLLVVAALIVMVVSVFFEKWIGLELIQTYQSVFFIWALATGYPFELSAFVTWMRYSNGYDDILNSDYEQMYSLSSSLIALGKEKQFLSNFNINIILIFMGMITLGVLAIIKHRYQASLEEVVSTEIKKKEEKVDKIFSWVFSKIFLMLVLFSMFQIIFSFCIQMGNQTVTYHIIEDEVNVLVAIGCFVLVFSMVSFVLYWYLLLPQHYSEQKYFMHLSFDNMSFYYPIIYLSYQSLFLLTLSICQERDFGSYLVLGLQTLYLLFLILVRPYSTIRNFNRFLHNATIIFNQLTTIILVCIIIRWNTLYSSESQIISHTQTAVYCFLILALLTICLTLAIVRLLIFNKDVNFKCIKKEVEDQKESAMEMETTMRKLDQEKYGALLKTEEQPVQMVMTTRQKRATTQQDSWEKRINHPENREKKASQDAKLKEDPSKVKKASTIEDNEYNEAYLSQFLNEGYIRWNQEGIEPQNKPKVTRSNIKRTNRKKAELMKSHLEQFMEQNNKKGSLAPKDDFRVQP